MPGNGTLFFFILPKEQTKTIVATGYECEEWMNLWYHSFFFVYFKHSIVILASNVITHIYIWTSNWIFRSKFMNYSKSIKNTNEQAKKRVCTKARWRSIWKKYYLYFGRCIFFLRLFIRHVFCGDMLTLIISLFLRSLFLIL